MGASADKDAQALRHLTKPPQRPHHWMNADGTCHAGELFEHGTAAAPLYTFEQMEAWVAAERQAVLDRIKDLPRIETHWGYAVDAEDLDAACARPADREAPDV